MKRKNLIKAARKFLAKTNDNKQIRFDVISSGFLKNNPCKNAERVCTSLPFDLARRKISALWYSLSNRLKGTCITFILESSKILSISAFVYTEIPNFLVFNISLQ